MKYVVLSDLHLGQNGADGSGSLSLLSASIPAHMPEAEFAHQKQQALADRVAAFAGPDPLTLVLCGDALDLSLATMRDACSDFLKLLERMPFALGVIYVTGNHDHHIWTLHTEYKRVLQPMLAGRLPLSGSIYEMTAPGGEHSPLLQRMAMSRSLLQRMAMSRPPGGFRIAYPHCELDLRDGADSMIVHFSHGHLTGGLYTLISRILAPQLKNAPPDRAAATVNVALIEFIYWLFGEMGERMGADGMMEALYSDIKKGKKSLFKELMRETVNVVLAKGAVSWIPDAWERALMRWLGGKIVEEVVKKGKIDPASHNRHEKLSATRDRFTQWLERTGRLNEGRSAYVFGHTHAADMFDVPGAPIQVFNMGSWLVEPDLPDPDSYVLLIDENGPSLSFVWEKI